MEAGWLLGGIACLLYCAGVVYGGVKKTPWLLKMVKLKLGKKMSDETAAKICVWFGSIVGVAGIVLFIVGAMQG